MKEQIVKTKQSVELIDAHIEQPSNGRRVQALTHGNILVSAVWTSDSINTFDAWMDHPKVPQSVKDRQMERYMK